MTDYPEALVERVRDAYRHAMMSSALPFEQRQLAGIRAALDASGLREAVEAMLLAVAVFDLIVAACPENETAKNIHNKLRAPLARIKGETNA